MTKKIYNKVMAEVYKMFAEQEDVKSILRCEETATIWEASEGTLHKFLVTAHDSQMNLNTLAQHGFTEKADVRELVRLWRKTKCAYITGCKVTGFHMPAQVWE